MKNTQRLSIATRILFALGIVGCTCAHADAPPTGTDVAVDRLAERVTALASITGSFGAVFSPDGKRVAFGSNRSGSPQVWMMNAEGGQATQVTRESDPVGSVAWSPDGSTLAYSVARGGGYLVQIWFSAPDGSGARRITAGGDENNFPGDFAPDGRYYFTSNKRDPAGTDAWIYDATSDTLEIAVKNEGLGGIDDIEQPAQRALVGRTVTRGNDNLWLVDLDDGKEVLLTPHSGPAIVYGALAPDGTAVYLGHNLDRDRLAFARIPLDAKGTPGKREALAERDDAELENFAISNAGAQALLAWNAGGRVELELMTLADGKRRSLPQAPAELVGQFEFTPDDRAVVMNASGSNLPADLWRVDLASGKYTQLTTAAHPGVDLATLVKPKLERFVAHDGLKLSGWLYLPAKFDAPGPVVLSFHGGPEGQERPAFRPDYQALVAQGIAVFAPNIRGSSGFGKAFLALDNHAKRFDANRDIESAAKHLVDAGIGAEGRLGIMGGSYGGYAVMVGLTDYPDTFAAGANLYGIVNFETFFSHSAPWMGAVSVGEYGDPKSQADLLKRLSPIHKLDRVKAATLVMHGANDTNVPVIEAEQVVDTLKARGVAVEYVLFPDEGHGWRKTTNRVRSSVELVRFFDRHLNRPTPTPDAASEG